MIWLIRHGETEWSLSGAHTGRTDIPLTEAGEEKARQVAQKLAGKQFSLVLVSPLQRARRTCELAGFGGAAQVDSDLMEWNYGDYEGRSTPEIQRERPGWRLFRDGVPNGESIEEVAARAKRVIDKAVAEKGDVALFAHGHFLRILSTVWLGLSPADARLFALDTGSVSRLGFEREQRVISQWNG
jgi:probable phosphoglycerate mutase